jgi:hypothetical protein
LTAERWTGNKGEWSEAYAFLALLTNPLIPAGNYNLENIGGKYYVVKAIWLPVTDGQTLQFLPLQESYISSFGEVKLEEIKTILPRVLDQIKSKPSTFELPEVQIIFEKLGISSFKASASTKIDIVLELPSLGGGQDQKLGFSIKSQLGSPSSLLNSSGATNIIWTVATDETTGRICVEQKNSDNRDSIKPQIPDFQFKGFTSETFLNNLSYFGEDFPEKLANMVRNAYFGIGATSMLEQIQLVAAERSGNVEENKLRYQTKNFLRAIALGMMPAAPWSGDLEGYGGYLIVKNNGELVCLHLENDDEFKNYLLNNVRFDWPSSSRTAPNTFELGILNYHTNFSIRFIQ